VGEGQSKDGKVMKKQSSSSRALVLLLFVLFTGCLSTPYDYERARVHKDIGTAYIESGQYNAALKELMQAEKHRPDEAQIHYLLGIAYYGKGMNDKAIESFKKAVDLKPDYSEAHNYLGTIYSNAGQWDAAIESFNRALENIVYDTPALALFNMGWAYYKKRDYSTALKMYAEASRRDPNTVLLPMLEKNMGLVNFDQGRLDEAIRHFRDALKIAPDFVEAQYWLGESYLQQQRRDEARAAFRAVVKAGPESKFGVMAQTKLIELKNVK
jgi:type IV pilus assembly protein PilF